MSEILTRLEKIGKAKTSRRNLLKIAAAGIGAAVLGTGCEDHTVQQRQEVEDQAATARRFNEISQNPPPSEKEVEVQNTMESLKNNDTQSSPENEAKILQKLLIETLNNDTVTVTPSKLQITLDHGTFVRSLPNVSEDSKNLGSLYSGFELSNVPFIVKYSGKNEHGKNVTLEWAAYPQSALVAEIQSFSAQKNSPQGIVLSEESKLPVQVREGANNMGFVFISLPKTSE